MIPVKSIKKNRNGTFTVFIYPNRRREQRTFSTQKLAQDFWLSHHLKREKANVYGEAKDNHVPLADLIEFYRKGVAKSPRSIVRDDWIVKRFEEWFASNRIHYVDQLKKDRIREYEQYRSAQGVKQRTVNIDLDFLNAALNYALRLDKIAFNPMGRYPFQPDGHHFERVLSNEEINALLASADNYGYYNVFYTILTLGLRAEEACYLQFGDIHGSKVQLKEKKIWEIIDNKKRERLWAPKWYRKRGGRWVYLDRNYAKDEYLQKILKGSDPKKYCFPDRYYKDGRPLDSNKLYKLFKKVARDARVKDKQLRDWKDLNVHSLRHVHISYAVARCGKDPNLSIPNIMENVGINDFQTMRRYTQAVKDLAENLPDPRRFPWQKR